MITICLFFSSARVPKQTRSRHAEGERPRLCQRDRHHHRDSLDAYKPPRRYGVPHHGNGRRREFAHLRGFTGFLHQLLYGSRTGAWCRLPHQRHRTNGGQRERANNHHAANTSW